MTISVTAAAAVVLAGCGQKPSAPAPAAEQGEHAEAGHEEGPAAGAEHEGGEHEEQGEDAAKLLASLPAPYNTADLENGKRRFALCRSCHTITPDGPNMTGPNLYGVFGRKAGSHEKFNYSDALKNADFTWDFDKLSQWLPDPQAMIPGVKMPPVAGLKGDKDKIDVIAYLKVETSKAGE
ncbi:cytochrome c family protein [Phenylobacterium sp.]|uniref:c-type cytochrome n=1 Tax=Phenylobacterium sp. TaxID=1871053 RepID=UPI0035B1B785